MATNPNQPEQEARSQRRILLKLRAVVFVDAQQSVSGVVKDISINGATLCLDYNLHKVKTIRLSIQFPPLVANEKPRAIEVSGNLIYTVYDSGNIYFRSGISFTKFIADSDQQFLQQRLSGG
jgi:hypothetical protein